MLKDLTRRSGPASLALTALAAIVIGCGGGGGGGGNGGGNGPPTTSTPATIGGGTNGNASGGLNPDTIYYLEQTTQGDTYDVKFVKEDGTGAGTLASGLDIEAPPASPDPGNPGKVVFAARPSAGSNFGIYRDSDFTIGAGTQTLVTSSYAAVYGIQVARDASKVVYVAATSLAQEQGKLYVVNAGGLPVPLDDAYSSASLSADGTKVVYDKIPAGEDDLELYEIALASPTPVRLTTNDFDDTDPQVSKDGTKIAFARTTSTGSYRLGVRTTAGTETLFAPVADGDLRSPAFNGDGSRLTFAVTNGPNAGLYTVAVTGGTATPVLTPLSVVAAYWTNSVGRAPGALTLGLSLPRRR